MYGFSLMCVCVCVWGGCVCKSFKERISLFEKKGLKNGPNELQAVLCIHGVKSQERGELLPPGLILCHFTSGSTHRLSLSATQVVPPCKQGSQQARTSWICVGEDPSFPCEPLPGDDMAPPGRPRRCAACTAHLSKPGHHTPHECSQSFFHSDLHRQSGTLLVLLRYKQGCFRCLNLHKIPIDLESEHFPKYTYYKIEERNPRDRRKTSEIQTPQWEP